MEMLNMYALLDKERYAVNRLILNEDVQRELSQSIRNSYKDFDYEFIDFDGSYKPDKDEAFVIQGFELAESIKKCGNDPIGQDLFRDKQSDLIALFTYIESEDAYVFQNIKRNQIFTRSGLSIFLDKDTFKKMDSLAISINSEIDCVYKNNNLYFKSYWTARQILDLRDHYKIATDKDLDEFIANDSIQVLCNDTFNSNADAWVRRKISLIQDSGTLETFQPRKIKEIAADYSVDVQLSENKIIVPNEKREVKKLLKFLDENIYKGPLTDETYETNSKREFTARSQVQ